MDDDTPPIAPEPAALVRVALGAILQARRCGPLGRWQFDSALHLAHEAIALGMPAEATELAQLLLAQEPSNERVCEIVLRGYLALNDPAAAARTYRHFITAAEYQRRPAPSSRLRGLASGLLREVCA